MYPQICIDINKLKHNTKYLTDSCKAQGIETIFGVVKVLAGDIKSVESVAESGITHIADSRIENLKAFKEINLPKVLLRLPMLQEVEDLVRYVDLSLNSELETIKKIDLEAKKQHKVHKIILMIDLGDLREGIWFKDDIQQVVREILKLKYISLEGIGTNLTCYGGVIPNEENLGLLLNIKNEIEKTHQIKLDIISGGNTSSLYLLFKNQWIKGINNLLLGEGFFLGLDTAYEDYI